MRLPLAYYGDPVLRKKGALIEKIDEEIRTLVQEMIETLEAEPGVGIAAPQVHRSLALFITCTPKYDEQWNEVEPGKIKVYINPKITAHSQETWMMSEGCLSIPSIREEVERPIAIRIEATDLEGNQFIEELSGYPARVFMHENDHIHGVLFIDRLSQKVRNKIDQTLRKMKKDAKQAPRK